jgi:hypothetical protein
VRPPLPDFLSSFSNQKEMLAAVRLRRDNTCRNAGEGRVSDRKYRQRGYQDRSDEKHGGSGERNAPSPAKRDNTFGPRPVNLPGTRTVSRCTQCGAVLPLSAGDKCPKCGFELHSCKQCMYFDPGARFECTQPIPERIAKKDARNDCSFYEIRVTREKETSTPASQRPTDARQAFDNLFKK